MGFSVSTSNPIIADKLAEIPLLSEWLGCSLFVRRRVQAFARHQAEFDRFRRIAVESSGKRSAAAVNEQDRQKA